MSLWKTLFKEGGGGHRPSTLSSRLRLESLDERIVPDATPITNPTPPPPAESSPVPQDAVTDVAVISLADDAGNLPNTYLILEKAGDQYVATYYDSATNHFYTGTASADTSLYLTATPELNAAMAQYGIAGNLNSICFTNADEQLTVPPTTLAGNSDEVQFGRLRPTAQPANDGLFPAIPRVVGGFELHRIEPVNDGILPYQTPYYVWIYNPNTIGPVVQVGPIVQSGPITPGGLLPPAPTMPRTMPTLPSFTQTLPFYDPFAPVYRPVRPAPPRPYPGPLSPPYIPTPGQFRPDGR